MAVWVPAEDINDRRILFFGNTEKLRHVVKSGRREFVVGEKKTFFTAFCKDDTAVFFHRQKGRRNDGKEEIHLFASHKRENVFKFGNGDRLFVLSANEKMNENRPKENDDKERDKKRYDKIMDKGRYERA